MRRVTKTGLAFHLHHGTLAEWCFSEEERREYIKEYKPVEEQKIRLRLLQIIPDNLLPVTLSKAGRAYDEAREAYHKAREAYRKVEEVYRRAEEAYHQAEEAYYKTKIAYVEVEEAYGKAREAYGKAGEVHGRAMEAYGKAMRTFNETRIDYMPQIEALHKKLCPDCPWDGETIFPR